MAKRSWTKPPAALLASLLIASTATAAAFAQTPLSRCGSCGFESRDDVSALAGAGEPIAARQAGAALLTVAARTADRVVQAVPAAAGEISPGGPDALPPADELNSAQMEALPSRGRDWASFLPGNSSTRTPTGTNGAPALQDGGSVVVDGANTELAFGNARSSRTRGPGPALMGPAADESTIRSVQLGTGEPVGTGGRVSVATQRGGSSLHGQAFLFDRQNLWGARNPLTQWVQQTALGNATTVPAFTAMPYSPGDREMLWGFGAGGPLLRRKLFWFAAVDGFNHNDPGVSTVKHPDSFFAQPSNDQMQVLSARLGLSAANPVAEGLQAYAGMLRSLDSLLGPAPRTSSQWTGFGRLDWPVTERQRVTVEGTGALWDSPGGGLTRASETYGAHSYGSSRADDQWILGRWELFLTPNLLAVTQGSAGRRFLTTPPQTPSSFEQSFEVDGSGRLPQMIVDPRYGFTMGNPSRFGPGAYPDEHLYEIQQQVSWARGNGLLLKSGISFRHNKDATGFLRNQAGTYSYASVENFASDALAFASFGLDGALNPMQQHNCDQTGKVWRDAAGTLHGLGYLPCYAWYSQTIGPSNWWLSTDDWAGFVTAQWQPKRALVASLAMRWELEQAPQPLAALDNPDLPLTERTPTLGGQWGPRASLAWGSGDWHRPVVRVGYGVYFGRTANATFENALTQTGSLKGDLNFFMRPTDNLNGGGAPPFPYVLAGAPATVVKPAAVEFAPDFRNGQVQQGIASLEEALPSHIHLEARGIVSLGRRLPLTQDVNLDPAVNPKTITYAVVDGNGSGPIKTAQITVPFYASWPSSHSATGFAGRVNANYQQVTEVFSRANSTYEAAMLRVTRTSRSGFSLHARYTYAHAMDWNPDESASISGPSVFDPSDLRGEYGTSSLDVRHAASGYLMWQPHWRLHGDSALLANGWALSAIGSFRSGMPYTMRTAGSLANEFTTTGTAIVALAPGMNGYGGDNRVYGVGRNTFRYPAAWKADMRVAKRFNFGAMRQLELLAESFNLFNHRNITEIETVGYSIGSGNANGGLPTLNFLTGLKNGQTEFGQPLNANATDFYRPREIQFGLRIRF